MALFGKKKTDGNGNGGKPPTDVATAPGAPDPDKAQKFFEHARSMSDSGNHAYAMTLWMQGWRFEPSNTTALEKTVEAALQAGLKKPSKDQLSPFNGKHPLDKVAVAILNWAPNLVGNWQQGLKAMELAGKQNADEGAIWIGEGVFKIAQNDQKAKKQHFVQLMDHFASAGGYDQATKAGEVATKLDPTDGQLLARVKNMSAEATMAAGGFENSNQKGGFRGRVKDSDKQRELEEEDRIDKSASALERMVARARADYESRPDDLNSIKKYGKALRDLGTPEAETTAIDLYDTGHETTQAFELRQLGDELRIRKNRRALALMAKKKQAEGLDEPAKQELALAKKKVLAYEAKLMSTWVEAYPTNLKMKVDLGRTFKDLGDHEKAIEQLQQAQGTPGQAVRVAAMLGECFQAMGWMDEAEDSFRNALSKVENQQGDESLGLRYGLMSVLEIKARDERSLAHAEEAFKLASGIATQQIGYKDIRERRASLQSLVKELRSAA